MAIPGFPGGQYTADGLTHDARGTPSSQAKDHIAQLDKRQHKEMAIDHDDVLDLAARTGLTAYDASYLWLARQLGADLVTLDRQLERAATAN